MHFENDVQRWLIFVDFLKVLSCFCHGTEDSRCRAWLPGGPGTDQTLVVSSCVIFRPDPGHAEVPHEQREGGARKPFSSTTHTLLTLEQLDELIQTLLKVVSHFIMWLEF